MYNTHRGWHGRNKGYAIACIFFTRVLQARKQKKSVGALGYNLHHKAVHSLAAAEQLLPTDTHQKLVLVLGSVRL
jgi:hypothetical protein